MGELMGAREDFETVRRAAHFMSQIAQDEPTDPVTCHYRVLAKASANEAAFIRLAKAGIQDEVVDVAYAVLAEDRPGGPASTWRPVTEADA